MKKPRPPTTAETMSAFADAGRSTRAQAFAQFIALEEPDGAVGALVVTIHEDGFHGVGCSIPDELAHILPGLIAAVLEGTRRRMIADGMMPPDDG